MPRAATVAVPALGLCLLAPKAFVPSGQAPSITEPPALRGGSAAAAPRDAPEAASAAVGGSALLGLGAATVLGAAAAARRKARTPLRAEPVTTAAAAAAAKAAGAAKAAAAAKGAAKTAGAVAGSGTAGSLKKTADENADDEELANMELNVMDRGTPKYEAIKAAKAKRKEKDWEVRTARNPDGTFGNPDDAYRGKADLYDPLMSLSERFLQESGNEFNPAFQIGVTEPLGYFDPLGFCKKGDEATFRNLRTAEIKHGRVAMMAALGAVVQHYVKFPGFGDVPAGLAAANSPPGSYGFIALFLAAGALELGVWTEKDGAAPGDFGDPLGLNQYNEDMRNRELNNGRAAMFAAIGIIAAELYTGKDAIEQLGL